MHGHLWGERLRCIAVPRLTLGALPMRAAWLCVAILTTPTLVRGLETTHTIAMVR